MTTNSTTTSFDPRMTETPQQTAARYRLRIICDAIAHDDDINTFHFKCIFNDGVDCEYEYLNDDGTIYSIELLLDQDASPAAYEVTVKRNIRDADGDRTREWFVESQSTIEVES